MPCHRNYSDMAAFLCPAAAVAPAEGSAALSALHLLGIPGHGTPSQSCNIQQPSVQCLNIFPGC